MKIVIEHHDKTFNIALASKEGAEPFLTIRGCRIVDGSNGRFVSWPAKKLDSGKYWNHVYASEAFVKAVIKEYDATSPKAGARDDDIPF